MAVQSVFAVSTETEELHGAHLKLSTLWPIAFPGTGNVCPGTPQEPGHTNLYPGNIVLLLLCYHFHSCNTALMSVPHVSHSYRQHSSPLCSVNQKCKKLHDKFIYQKIPFIRLSLVLLCATMFQATGLGASRIWMKGKAANKSETKKQNNTANADPCSHSGVKITPLIVQLQARVHSQFTAPPYPEQGISVCVHKYWAVRWKRAPLHSGMGVPTLNAWVTDYFLTSWTSTLYKEEPKPQPEEAKLETRALQIIQNHIVALRILLHYNAHSCSSSNFKLFFFTPPPCQLNVFSCNMGHRKHSHSHF